MPPLTMACCARPKVNMRGAYLLAALPHRPAGAVRHGPRSKNAGPGDCGLIRVPGEQPLAVSTFANLIVFPAFPGIGALNRCWYRLMGF